MDNMEESQPSRKRSRRTEKKQKRIEEIDKPRGLSRGLPPEKIMAGQLFHSVLYFLVKWHGCLELDVVPGCEFSEAYPDFVIKYYEKCAPFSVRHPVGKVPRPAPELPSPEPLPPCDIPSEISQLSQSSQEPDNVPPEEPPLPEIPAEEPENQQLEVPVN